MTSTADSAAPSAPAPVRRRAARLLWRCVVVGVHLALLYMAATALVMIHAEDYFRSLFPPGLNEQSQPSGKGSLTAEQFATVPVGLGNAMATARRYAGEAPLDYVQLYVDRAGNTVWKTLTRKDKAGAVTEVLVNARTGESTVTRRTGYSRERLGPDGEPQARYTHYAKMVKGFHTGKYFGPAGTWGITAFAVLAIMVSLRTLWTAVIRPRSCA